MDNKLFFVLLLAGLLADSCQQGTQKELNPCEEPPIIEIFDSNWKDEMSIKSISIIDGASQLEIYTWLDSSAPVDDNLNSIVRKVFSDGRPNHLTEAEQFARERIRERSQSLVEYFEEHIAPYTHNPTFLANIYIRQTPTVYANKELFGLKPGDDLSSFFVFRRGAQVKCSGPNYRISDTRNPCGLSLEEFFSEGTMMPIMFSLRSTLFPEELSEDDDITLTFVFPVTIEHYWSWLLELYENPEAEESFTDTEMIMVVNLKDLSHYN